MPERTARPTCSPLQWVALPLCFVYAAGVLALLALRFLLPAWPPLLLAFSTVGPFVYAPLLLLLPLAIVSRSWPAIGALLAVVLLFLAGYLPFFLPRVGAAPALEGRSITTMAYNLGVGVSEPASLAAAIDAVGADLVALEELYPAAARTFDQTLAARYPHRILETGAGGNGLLSRYPIASYEYFLPAGADRLALQADLDVDGQMVRAIIVHPVPPVHAAHEPGTLPLVLDDQHMEAQMRDVAGRAKAAGGPALVMGDFNMSDQSRPYLVISEMLGDAFREAGFGFGFTFPVSRRVGGIALPGPLARIDYVFHSDALYAERADVGCGGSSDHCYVVAELSRVAQPLARGGRRR